MGVREIEGLGEVLLVTAPPGEGVTRELEGDWKGLTERVAGTTEGVFSSQGEEVGESVEASLAHKPTTPGDPKARKTGGEGVDARAGDDEGGFEKGGEGVPERVV